MFIRSYLSPATLVFLSLFSACPSPAGSALEEEASETGTPSNRARFIFDCDLGDVTGEMRMDIEVIGDAGIVFGPGPNPSITGVIDTGDIYVHAEGTIRTSNGGLMVFTASNGYADFTNMGTYARWRSRISVDEEGSLWLLSDPTDINTEGDYAFPCTLRDAYYL